MSREPERRLRWLLRHNRERVTRLNLEPIGTNGLLQDPIGNNGVGDARLKERKWLVVPGNQRASWLVSLDSISASAIYIVRRKCHWTEWLAQPTAQPASCPPNPPPTKVCQFLFGVLKKRFTHNTIKKEESQRNDLSLWLPPTSWKKIRVTSHIPHTHTHRHTRLIITIAPPLRFPIQNRLSSCLPFFSLSFPLLSSFFSFVFPFILFRRDRHTPFFSKNNPQESCKHPFPSLDFIHYSLLF